MTDDSELLRCWACNEDIPFDDEVWIDTATATATMKGVPFHIGCAPPELPLSLETPERTTPHG